MSKADFCRWAKTQTPENSTELVELAAIHFGFKATELHPVWDWAIEVCPGD